MRYWDASALVPLIIAEPETDRARSWLEDDLAIATWAWTRAEIAGAIERRVREGTITRPQRQVVLDHLQALAATWDEVVDVLAVRRRALALLARHPLRAAAAAQLGAALLVAEDDPASLTFVCFDGRLALAAERRARSTAGSRPTRRLLTRSLEQAATAVGRVTGHPTS